MKKKIVIGLGLMLSLATGMSCADDSLGDSGSLEINKDTPFELSLANKLDMSGDRYYKITCQLNNVHSSSSLIAQVELAHGSFSPVSVNGSPASRVGVKRFEAPLMNGVNTLVMEHVLPGSITKTKYSIPKYTTITKDVEICSRWLHNSAKNCHNESQTQSVRVPNKDRQLTTTTYDDKLIFFAKDDQFSHKGTGTGYRIDSCTVAVESNVSSTDSQSNISDMPTVADNNSASASTDTTTPAGTTAQVDTTPPAGTTAPADTTTPADASTPVAQ